MIKSKSQLEEWKINRNIDSHKQKMILSKHAMEQKKNIWMSFFVCIQPTSEHFFSTLSIDQKTPAITETKEMHGGNMWMPARARAQRKWSAVQVHHVFRLDFLEGGQINQKTKQKKNRLLCVCFSKRGG